MTNIPNIPEIFFGSDPFGGAIVNMMKTSPPPVQNTTPLNNFTFPSVPSVPSVPISSGSPLYTSTVSGPLGLGSPLYTPAVTNEFGYQQSTLDPNKLLEPTFSFGLFAGKSFQKVVDENPGLIQKHDRSMIIPHVCGARCNLNYNFTKWFEVSYKKTIYLCDACPWYVIARTIRFPDDDPKYPGVLFNDVYIKDFGYFESLPDVGRYISIKALYRKRLNRSTEFPACTKSKHAGKTFEQVLMSNPDYFKWIIEKYSGKDDVFADAVDWYSENSHRAPVKTNNYEKRVLPESASVPAPATLFESGKYRGKSFSAVFIFDPGYFQWLSTSYRSNNPNMIAAIEWFHQQPK